jgi:hypothetical protein
MAARRGDEAEPAPAAKTTPHAPAPMKPRPPSEPQAPAHGVMRCNANGAPLAGTGVPLPEGVPPPGAGGGADVPPGAALLGGSVLGCLLSDRQGGVTIRQTRAAQ